MSFEIETIRENFNFESESQYSDFNLMAEDFLAKQLMDELNQDEN